MPKKALSKSKASSMLKNKGPMSMKLDFLKGKLSSAKKMKTPGGMKAKKGPAKIAKVMKKKGAPKSRVSML